MKLPIILLCIIFLIFGIGSHNLRTTEDLLKERKESYDACIRLRNKAPNLDLKCEHLLDDMEEDEERGENDNSEIKTLFIDENNTRKVNKREEIKLRNLIQKLSNGNKLRKD